MKLYEVMYGAQDFVVYKVSSSNTDDVYYGYTKGEDVRTTFLQGAGREMEPDRGDVRMITAAGGEDNLKFEELEAFTDEMEAFVERNNLRATDSQSITGPSVFPASIYARARAAHPDDVKRWSPKDNPNFMTAREAMAAGHLKFANVKALGPTPTLRQQVMTDLDKLLYPEFKKKYSL